MSNRNRAARRRRAADVAPAAPTREAELVEVPITPALHARIEEARQRVDLAQQHLNAVSEIALAALGYGGRLDRVELHDDPPRFVFRRPGPALVEPRAGGEAG